MNFTQSFKLAIKSIMSSKMRSLLTMLGIIIGVASVIILISLMQGVTNEILSVFESMGTNSLYVNVNSRGSSRSVSVDDIYAIADNNKDVFLGVSPRITVSKQIKYGTETYSSSITGVAENYLALNEWNLKQGRFISYTDVEDSHNVAVVGSYVDREVFEGNSIGKYIRIDGKRYLIVGVLEETADSTKYSSDDSVYIPYTLASNINKQKTNSYVFMTNNTDYNQRGTALIERMLYSVMQDDKFYNITDMSELVEEVSSITGTMTTVLVGIAAISLLVGGIGIMNIMLVSVTERTREIGIRKSLGAKRRDIRSQFIIEAATTSALGGVIGIGLGVVSSSVLGNLMGIESDATITAIMVSFSISVFIGILFGFLPANKASKLNPIDALRHD